MGLSTYAGLLAAIGDYSVRDDMGPRAPEFVTLAEAQLNRVLRVNAMIVRINLSITAEYSPAPDDMLALRSFALTGTPATRLTWVSPDQMDALKAGLPAVGRPNLYSIVGAEIRVLAVPDQSYTAELSYYRRLPPLVDNESNWLLSAGPDVYLYGALVQLGILTEDDRLASWAEAYQRAVTDLQTSDIGDAAAPLLTSISATPA